MFDKKLFIHIPKHAGLAIRGCAEVRSKFDLNEVRHYKNAEYIEGLHAQMVEMGESGSNYQHARWKDMHIDTQCIYQCFAVTRNPWDRVVSRYMFAKRLIEVDHSITEQYVDVSSFEAFIEERHKWGGVEYMWHRAVRGWYPAFDHVSDDNGKLRCDMLRFDHLEEDVNAYFNTNIKLGVRNATGMLRGSYQDLYTPKLINTIGDWYHKDVDTWGYDFDGSATKNYWNK